MDSEGKAKKLDAESGVCRQKERLVDLCFVSALDVRVPFQEGGWVYVSGVRGQACVEKIIIESRAYT